MSRNIIFFLSITIFSVLNAFSQNEEHSHALKASSLFSAQKNSTSLYGPTLTYLVNTKHDNRHEFSLERLIFQKQQGTTRESRQFRLETAYQYDFHFLKSTSVQPFLGMRCQLAFERLVSDPYDPQVFKVSRFVIPVDLEIAPSIHFRISPRIFLDTGFRFPVLSLFYIGQQVHNPGISLRQQKRGGFESTFFHEDKVLYLGIGISI